MRKGGEPKYAHLSMELHVFIEVFAPVPDAYLRMAHAMEEVKKFLFPVSVYLPAPTPLATLTHRVPWPNGEEVVCGSSSDKTGQTHSKTSACIPNTNDDEMPRARYNRPGDRALRH